MPRFAANLSMLFNEVPFIERFAAAAEEGFTGVEFLFPYAFEPADLAAELERHNLTQVLFNLPPGDWEAGERGLAALPGREAEFRDSVDRALEYATTLNCARVHAMAGVAPDGLPHEAMHTTYIDNLRFAARRLAAHGIQLLIEPINTRDMPGYFLNHQYEGHAVIAAVGEPNVAVQMDFYHTQIMDGDVWMTYRRYRDDVGHIQIAGVPDRHEPDTGELSYPWLFEQLDADGYADWIGCEYHPRTSTIAGLDWFREQNMCDRGD
ncbi:2-oxo-tetronate isomerase [Salinisphaera sp.]|uniref:2-oxo-tetronate isomerase n=1 Tax=Salinisphaera sp. TaxID=1914330 RepID=UPI002D79A35C|nr:2-oxo-tetronate isomerase [Salinisphaera sp.]HET7315045.1 2-oxo-tetronate isomerase [Salinisphaera sp.]